MIIFNWILVWWTFFLCCRSRHTGFPSPTLSQTKKDTDGVQSLAAAKVGARVREKPLRGRRGKETTGAVAVLNRNAGKTDVHGIKFNMRRPDLHSPTVIPGIYPHNRMFVFVIENVWVRIFYAYFNEM